MAHVFAVRGSAGRRAAKDGEQRFLFGRKQIAPVWPSMRRAGLDVHVISALTVEASSAGFNEAGTAGSNSKSVGTGPIIDLKPNGGLCGLR